MTGGARSPAVLLVSHGSVDDLDDLSAFVTNVRRGRPPPDALVAELRHRYEAIGGSPLNTINAEVARKLAERLGLRVALANRLWRPTVKDVLAGLAAEGHDRVAVVALAQHSAHVYADDARRAAAELGAAGPTLASAPGWGGRDDLARAFAGRIASVLATAGPVEAAVVLTAHSLPKSVVDAGDPYERDFRAAAAAIAAEVRALRGEVRTVVAFQSQGMAQGPNAPAWLGPDLATALDDASATAKHVVLAPVGFLADHVEVLYDLDVEARAMAAARGLTYARMPSLNAADDFVAILARVAAGPLAELGHG